MNDTIVVENALPPESVPVIGDPPARRTIETDLRRLIERKARESIYSSYSKAEFLADFHYKAMRRSPLVDLQA